MKLSTPSSRRRGHVNELTAHNRENGALRLSNPSTIALASTTSSTNIGSFNKIALLLLSLLLLLLAAAAAAGAAAVASSSSCCCQRNSNSLGCVGLIATVQLLMDKQLKLNHKHNKT